LERLKGLRLRLFRRFLESAQRYAPLREDGLADVGLAYPLLREMLREVGNRMVEGGAIAAADDIYWLTEQEVVAAASALDRGESPARLSESVAQHKATWRAARKATPPLGLFKVMGKTMAKVQADRGGKRAGDTLAWTPLFARAAAVVTDIGGPLSHGSIVAREYGIPAVLGTGAATRRIQSGQVITVDGSAGVITLAREG
jgi:pyruvate,water dikinase